MWRISKQLHVASRTDKQQHVQDAPASKRLHFAGSLLRNGRRVPELGVAYVQTNMAVPYGVLGPVHEEHNKIRFFDL